MKEEYKRTVAEVFAEVSRNITKGEANRTAAIALTTVGSEVDNGELIAGVKKARKINPGLEIILIGPDKNENFSTIPAATDKDVQKILGRLFAARDIDGAVAMHYPFPVGVSTVGKIFTPAWGKSIYVATTTGTSDVNRVQAMIKNAVLGIAVAKTDGIEEPSVGILNVEGARQAEMHLSRMQYNGYKFRWGESGRDDGGHILRGNDLITGSVDVLVTDSLTGNIIMKIFSAYSSGGHYETLGCGYGPGVGEEFDNIICILSRASGAPVVAGAIDYCFTMITAKLMEQKKREIRAAKKAGWILESENQSQEFNEPKIITPPRKTVNAEIIGIDIFNLEHALSILWKNNIFASSGMGCLGPVIMIAEEDRLEALNILKNNRLIP